MRDLWTYFIDCTVTNIFHLSELGQKGAICGYENFKNIGFKMEK